jgi:hypothetical protein
MARAFEIQELGLKKAEMFAYKAADGKTLHGTCCSRRRSTLKEMPW